LRNRSTCAAIAASFAINSAERWAKFSSTHLQPQPADPALPLDRVQETSVVDYSLTFNDCKDRFEALRREFHCSWYLSPRLVKCGRTVVEVWKTENCRKFLFRFYNGVEFIVDRVRESIWVNGFQNASLQAAFLLGLRKSASLHGAAIGWGNSAIALLEESYSGKSLLSANMAARGIEVLSDDLVALDVVGSAVQVYPGYPWICLRRVAAIATDRQL
jgi:hypothetical protein